MKSQLRIDPEIVFPMMARLRSTNTIVLMENTKRGMVIHQGDGICKLGEIRMAPEGFTVFTSKEEWEILPRGSQVVLTQ